MKQGSERSQRFYFYSSEVKRGAEHSQKIHFNRSEIKPGSDRSERFHLNSSELISVVSTVTDFVVIVVK